MHNQTLKFHPKSLTSDSTKSNQVMTHLSKRSDTHHLERKTMQQTLNRIDFCTPKTLIQTGFSRRDSKIIMDKIVRDYKKEGYVILNKQGKIPMSFAEKWAVKNLHVNLIQSSERS